MQRGAYRSAFMVSLVAIVGIVALVNLLAFSPSGNVAQGEPFFVTADLGCFYGPAQFAGYVGVYERWCCPEHIVGDNPASCIAMRHVLY